MTPIQRYLKAQDRLAYVERAERAYERMVAAWKERPPTGRDQAKMMS